MRNVCTARWMAAKDWPSRSRVILFALVVPTVLTTILLWPSSALALSAPTLGSQVCPTFATGACRSLGVATDGSLLAWGEDCFGQPGRESITRQPCPVLVAGGMKLLASATTTYTLTTSVPGGGGSITCDPEQSVYDEESTVTLTAVPEPGYAFIGWGGDAAGCINPLTLIMDEDKSVTATFAATSGPFFSDISSSPYKTAVEALVARGIITGFADGTFRPLFSVTRQQFAKMIVLAGGYPVSASDVCPFVDVVPNMGMDPLYPSRYVAVAAAHGITQGKTATTFDPYSPITRYQVISMVVRTAYDLRPDLLATPPGDYTDPAGWGSDPTHGDNALVAEYSDLLMGLAPMLLDPYGNMTRGEVAQVLCNLVTMKESIPPGSQE